MPLVSVVMSVMFEMSHINNSLVEEMVAASVQSLSWKGWLASPGLCCSVEQCCQKTSTSHRKLRSGPELMASLCVSFGQVILISAQFVEVFSPCFMRSLF